jgi:hypothetical protein
MNEERLVELALLNAHNDVEITPVKLLTGLSRVKIES